MSSLEQFCAFVKYAGDEEQEDYVAQLLAAGKETVNMVNEVFKDFTEDEELQELLWRQKIAELDRNSELYRAEERGSDSARTSIAQKMKEEGFTADTIVKMTGLDAETVEKL